MESLHRPERTQVYQNDIAQGLLTMPEVASKIGIHMAKQKKSRDQHPQPAFVFDLDGTLIDRVYQHILAWREALRAVEIELSNWCIHRRIGMSDSLMLNACMRGAGRKLDKKQIEKLQDLQTKAYMKMDLDHCVVIGDSVGFACRPASPCSRRRFIGGRIWRGRIGARGRLPCLSGPRRFAEASR